MPLTFLSRSTDLMWWFCVSPLPTPIPSTMSRPCGTQKSSIFVPELLSFWWAASWTCDMLTWKPLTGPGDLWLGRGTGAQQEGRDMGTGHHCGSLLKPKGDPLTLMSLLSLGANSHQNQQRGCSLIHSLTCSLTHSHPSMPLYTPCGNSLVLYSIRKGREEKTCVRIFV